MDSFPVEERINSDGVANPLHDVLDWDFSESTETAWSKAQNSRVGRAGRTFGYQANRSRRQFRTHKSASLAVDEDNAYSADSSPDFSRSSGRSVISEQSEPFVPPEEVPARPRRHRQHRSMSMFGSTRPTNLSQSMDLTRATSETSDFTRESSASSMNVESFSEGWQEKSAYLGEGTVCPPRPRRHRQARSMSMFGSTQPSNYIRCHSLNNVDQGPPSFLLPSDETKSFPEWQAKSSPALEETDVALPPQLRLHRSSSMLGSTTPTNLTASFSGSIPPWGENSNPQRVESTLDTKKKDGHERQFKKIRARRHSITGSVPPLSDMKKPSSSTFSHLAQDAGPWGETPATIQKLAFDCRDLSEVPTQSSPERSVASSRKRGVCGSPVRDLEDRSACLSALSTSSSRMTRIFAPEVDIDIPFAPSLKVESSQREMDIESDDGDDESNASPNESFRSTTSHTEKMVHTSTVDEAKRGTPEFILETMSSYQDLKFLIKALRDKSKKKGPVLHSSSWTVAPPAAWSPTRRSRFLTWAKDCLRFSLRFAGAGAAYLQIPCEMGANVSKNLERALIYHKQNEVRVVETDGDDFGLGSCTKPERSSFEPRSTPAPFSLSCPTPAPPHCDETSNLVSGLESLTMRESSTKASNQKMVRTVTVDPHVPQQVKSRQSLDNHVRSNDLMNHLHGFSPDEQDVKPVRMSFGKPPRLSMGSTATSATSEAVHNIECFATPLMNDDRGWGSRPVEGRDWGGSSVGCPEALNVLLLRFEESCRLEGVRDSFGAFARPANLTMDLVSTTEEVNTERIAPENEQSVKDSPSVDVMSEKKQKRRERSFAKHKRMSLWASTAQSEGPLVPKQKPLFRGHKSMGRIIESVQARFSDSLAFLDEETATDQENIVDIETSEHLLEEEHLTHIFGYLTETEILCTASLVSTTWADAATAASVQRMIASVGHTEQEDDDGDIGEDEDTSLALVEKSASFPSMDRSWSYLNTMFPWGCFLSEGAFKKVFKVHNSTTGQAEALSLMDIDAIVDKKTVAAELAVSVMLSSLARRAICPNFVVTRGVFTAPYAPAPSHWGTAENKKPKGSAYDKSKSQRKPREPTDAYPGRFQYIRMELCNEGDAEEYLKRQVDEVVDPKIAQALVFQTAFALHAAADKFSVKHYDIKLLNVFMHRYKNMRGNLVLRYGLGCHMFSLSMPPSQALIAKVADYGTANISPQSTGQPVTIAQFTTIENTPPDFFILGDHAKQGHGHDCFGLGLCMLHLYTGHAPYEEILEDVKCPAGLKKKLRKIWEDETTEGYDVLRSVILSDVYKDEVGNIIDGEPDETPYDTLYRFLVLFGVPETPFEQKKCPKVWKAIFESLLPAKSKSGKPLRMKQNSDATRYHRDCRKYSILKGSNKHITRARKGLKSTTGGLDLLLSLCSFDPSSRASALEVLNSPFMTNLIEAEGQTYAPEDTVQSYTAFSMHR